MENNIVDIRESTIGFKLNGTISEVSIDYVPGLIVLYTTKDGFETIVEGENSYIINMLAKDGINAVIKEKE